MSGSIPAPTMMIPITDIFTVGILNGSGCLVLEAQTSGVPIARAASNLPEATQMIAALVAARGGPGGLTAPQAVTLPAAIPPGASLSVQFEAADKPAAAAQPATEASA